MRPGSPIRRSTRRVLKLSRLPSGQAEIFASIQGEGRTRGLPSVFVRLALCNLRCIWCDTKYTWDWEHYDGRVEIIDVEPAAVAAVVQELGHHNIVITGGEPLLQKRPLGRLVEGLKEQGRRVEMETNGTIFPSDELAVAVDQWNVSPKIANSGNHSRVREFPAVLGWFAAQPNAYFKFVVAAPTDVQEIGRLTARYFLDPARVILMPEAQDEATMVDRSSWLEPACDGAGFSFSPRLQITLWRGARAR